MSLDDHTARGYFNLISNHDGNKQLARYEIIRTPNHLFNRKAWRMACKAWDGGALSYSGSTITPAPLSFSQRLKQALKAKRNPVVKAGCAYNEFLLLQLNRKVK